MEIVAAAKRIDGVGELASIEATLDQARRAGLRIKTFEIARAEIPWSADLPEGTLRGAFAPIEVMARARRLFADDAADLVVVRGYDPIRTRFRHDRGALDRALRVYGGRTFLEGYELVARAFIDREGVTIDNFRALSASLFQNYLRTWERRHPGSPPPDARWFAQVNELFRGVDCANPYIDFEGCLVLTADDPPDLVRSARVSRIAVAGIAVEQACPDGIEHFATIASYAHLRSAFDKACQEARVDFAGKFLRREAMLDVYTCYPVVPLAFLVRSGLVSSLHEVDDLLEEHEVTLTGGLNLGRAPGNNTTLGTLIDAVDALHDETRPGCIGIHSVGALGHVQAFCILERASKGASGG